MSQSLKSVFISLSGLSLVIFLAWFWAFQKARSIEPIQAHRNAFLMGAHPRLFASWDPSADTALLKNRIQALGAPLSNVELGWWICLKLEVQFDPNQPQIAPQSEAVVADCSSGAKIVALVDFKLPEEPVPIVLSLDTRQPGLETASKQYLNTLTETQRQSILIHADAEGVHKALRADFPMLAFGSPQAKLIQLEMASHFGLMPLVNLSSDAIVSLQTEWDRQSDSSRARFRESTLREAHRRGLKRYVGPVQSLEEVEMLLEQNVDGVLAPSSLLR